MPETSIIIKAEDRYSSVLKNMSNVTKAFDKESEHLERTLHDLSGEKSILQAETDKARRAMKEAQRQFAETHSEADGLRASLAGQEYEDYRRKLETINKTMKETEKQIQSVEGVASKSGSSGGSRIDTIISTLAAGGLGTMLGNIAQEGANTLIGSTFGGAVGNTISSALSMAISGAAIVHVLPVVGPALGALAGAGIGALSGKIQEFSEKDDAFKTYYRGLYDTVNANTTESLTGGKELAKQRETTRTAFVNELGAEQADRLLADIQTTANATPFLYDELTGLSRTLLSYGTAAEDIIPTLTKVGDAGAAKGLASGDIGTVASYLGRMQSSDKAMLEYLNPLMERGFAVFEWLAEAKGTDQAGIYDMISKGDLSGKWVSDVILGKFEALYGGMMTEQSKTTEGLESTLQGLRENIQSAGGNAYNESRKDAYSADIAAYNGALGEELKLVSAAGSEAQAYSENLRDQYTREALGAVLLGEKTTVYSGEQVAKLEDLRGQYQAAQAVWNNENTDRETRMLAAKNMEDLRETTETLATELFESSEWSQKLETTEEEQTAAIRENTKGLYAATAAWRTENRFSIGMAGARNWNQKSETTDDGRTAGLGSVYDRQSRRRENASRAWSSRSHSHAFGLGYVPFDGYPALLHQGERVLTAQEARSAGGQRAVNVTVNVTENTVRSEEDLDRLAERFAAAIQEKALLFGG